MDFDPSELDVDSGPSTDQQEKLTEMCARFASLDREISELEEKLSEKKSQKNEMAHKTLVDYMNEIGQDVCGLPQMNCDVHLKPYYKANISADWPDAQRERAFAWLDKHGFGDVIKTVVSVAFGRDERDEALELRDKLAEEDGLAVDVASNVPWNTLTSLVREQTEKGDIELPLDLLGATVGQVVKIVPRKD